MDRWLASANQSTTQSPSSASVITCRAAPCSSSIWLIAAKLNTCGPKQTGNPLGRGLQHVVAARLDQAATDERDIRRTQQHRQFAHGVAEIDLGLRVAGVVARTSSQSQLFPLAQAHNALEAFRVTRHQDQQGIRKT
jgi:hypothetical protein